MLIISKLAGAAVLFLLAILAGFLPRHFSKHHQHLLHKGDSFARGVFLSAALLHLLPDAEHSLSKIMPDHSYPFATLIMLIAFFFLFVLEKSVNFFTQQNKNFATAYLLALLIMVHSFIEGAAIGINSTLASALIIFFAVIAHKGSESFALAANFFRFKIPAKKTTQLIILFSLMTPIGIIVASTITQFLTSAGGLWGEAIFNAFAAGTFLYLGAVHSVAEPETLDCHEELWAMLTGAALMAVVAIWV